MATPKYTTQGKWPVRTGIGWTQPAVDRHHTCTVCTPFSPFAYRFSPYWEHFDNGNIVSESKSQCFFGYHECIKITLRGICAVLEEVEWSHNRLKWYANGLKQYANGESMASVYSRLCPPMPVHTGHFPCASLSHRRKLEDFHDPACMYMYVHMYRKYRRSGNVCLLNISLDKGGMLR